MAVQLILKNSAVQDKEATAAQLAAGELALNYHSSGPFLQCEDTAGNVWRLGGVVIASTAPTSPSKGAWWLDSDDDSLYFYDGSSWIEIQTGETAPGDITEGTARQLLQTNAAGNGTEWTSDIDVPGTLDVTGVATFDNNVVITGNLTVNGTTTTIDTTTLVVEDKNIEMGAVGTPTDSTADGGGITLKGATDKTINWVNATDAWTSSERFDFPAGTAAAPSVILNGDVNSGIYQPGADQVAISTNGSARLYIDASGRVGLGVTSFTAYARADNLVIDGTGHRGITIGSGTSSQSFIAFAPNGATGADTYKGYINYDNSTEVLNFGTASTDRVAIDSSGRVGIGTSSPEQLIDVRGTTNPSIQVKSTGTASTDNARLRIAIGGTTATSEIYFADSAASAIGAIQYRHSDNRLSFTTNNDVRAVIDSSGRVGVGTTSPSGGQLVVRSTLDASNKQLVIQDATNGLARKIGVDSSNNMRFYDGNTERMVIDSSGRVGVGTSSPTALLHVSGGDFEIDQNIMVRGSDTRGVFVRNGANTQWGCQLQGNGNAHFLGNVGVGTTSPGTKFEVNAGHIRLSTNYRIGIGGTGASPNDAFVKFATNELQFFTNNSQKAAIDSSGRLLVGTSSAAGSEVLQANGVYPACFVRASTSGGPIVNFKRNRGTSPSDYTAIQNNDNIGTLQWAGAYGSQYAAGASIAAFADGQTWASGDCPGRLVFSTTADGASSPTERVRIEASGKTKFSGAAYGVENTITASAFNLNNGNLWTCGAIAIPNPTNAVAGLMGSIRVTAAPTSFGSNFDHPGGSYTAPTSFPAVAPFYCVSSTNILLGSWTQGIA